MSNYLFTLLSFVLLIGLDSCQGVQSPEITGLQKQIEELIRENKNLLNQIEKQKRNLKSLDEAYIELSKKYRELEVKTILITTIRTPESSETKVIKSKITAINDKGNMVVLGIGEESGVKVGTEFTVYRGDKFIAKIRVDKVGKNSSTAIAIPDLNDQIQEGDDITTSPF